MTIRTFDPFEVSCILGEYILGGFSADMIEVDRSGPAWEKVVGCTGEVTRVKSNDKSGIITLTLQQTSPSNDDLSTLALLDEVSNSGLRPFMMKDNLGSTIYTSPAAYVEKIPAAAYGNTQKDRVWVLHCGILVPFLGGNPIAAA